MNRRIIESGPLPVSRAYRQMFEHAEEGAAFHAISLFSEPLIKWYGVLALVVLRQQAPGRLREGGLLPQFLSPSLGHWVQIIRLAAQLRTELVPGSPIQDAFAELSTRLPEALRSVMTRVEEYLGTPLSKKTLLDFLEGCVAYRNKTRGHGAPSMRHQAEFARYFREGWEEFLDRLEFLYHLKLIYVERSENLGPDAIHTLRACNGLHSTVMTEKMTLARGLSLSSRSVHVFSEGLRPLIELSPILVRHPTNDSFCYLNSGRKALEYLCYDGNDGEYYRPEIYDTAVRRFFQDLDTTEPDPHHRESPLESASPAELDLDLPFGSLGYTGWNPREDGQAASSHLPQFARWLEATVRALRVRR